jgi:quercetin dioxygenase-like cupin family protein
MQPDGHTRIYTTLTDATHDDSHAQQCILHSVDVAGRGVVAVKARSGKTFARHTHEDYGIGILLAGAQRSWSGRGTVEAGVGDLITVNPGEVHDGAPIGGSRTWAMLYLTPEKVSEVACDIREGKSAEMEFVSPVIRDPLTVDHFIATHAAFRYGDEEAANEQFILLIAGLCRMRLASQTGYRAYVRFGHGSTMPRPSATLWRIWRTELDSAGFSSCVALPDIPV